jgi:hypothetical protein
VSRPPTPHPLVTDDPGGNRRIWLVTAAIGLLIALPVGVSIGLSWVDLPWSNSDARSAPDWVGVPQVRATTIDGAVVKARVALDVQSAAARTTIQRRTQQVGLLLEVSVASHTREQIRSPQGIAQLAQDMRSRLNSYLESEGVDVVKAVAIQDLIVNPQ